MTARVYWRTAIPCIFPHCSMATAKKNKDVAGADSPAETPAAKDAATASTDTKRRPVKVFVVEDVAASIFAREYNGRVYHGVSFTRWYKDSKGERRYTKSFDVEDLGKVIAVAQQASEWLHGLNYPGSPSAQEVAQTK